KETILRMAGHFQAVIREVCDNPRKEISQVDILPLPEKQQLLNQFNQTQRDYPGDQTIHRLFAEQVGRTPDRIATVGIGTRFIASDSRKWAIHISYGELNHKSHRLAYWLKEKGVTDDTIVGIMIERSVEMVIGILGILKAGAAYMPIDPEYPEERIKYMLKDSGAKILLTLPGLSEKYEKLSIVNCQLLMVNEEPYRRRLNTPPKEANSINNYQFTIHNSQLKRNNLAYIIYTSGSTGKPKGVLIEHKNVVRLMFNYKFQFDFNEKDVWTLFHSFGFDFSVWEMYGALLYGGQLVVVPLMTTRDPHRFRQLLKQHEVTVLNQTPSAFYNLAAEEMKLPGAGLNLRYVIFGGEALK
ncbi:MAG: AMP-binding protein, partial [bacterium]|nr:AMP-binding protein [bacterium]